MKQNKPKYKIIYQSKENVWGIHRYKKKFSSKKWSRLTYRLDKRRYFLFRQYRRPRSLKVVRKQRLLNKQKFKSFYGHISYSKLKKEYNQIKQNQPSNIIDTLIINLEKRLDIFLVRSRIYRSIFQAKQAIKHNFIYVNDKIISHSNYKLKNGDFIKIPTNYLKIKQLPYTEINRSLNLLIFLRNPKRHEIKYKFNFYGKYLFEYLNKK